MARACDNPEKAVGKLRQFDTLHGQRMSMAGSFRR